MIAERHYRFKRRGAAFSALGASLITTAIWFATCWGSGGFDPFFWPGIVIAITVVNLVRTAASHDEIVDNESGGSKRRRDKGEQRRPGWLW